MKKNIADKSIFIFFGFGISSWNCSSYSSCENFFSFLKKNQYFFLSLIVSISLLLIKSTINVYDWQEEVHVANQLNTYKFLHMLCENFFASWIIHVKLLKKTMGRAYQVILIDLIQSIDSLRNNELCLWKSVIIKLEIIYCLQLFSS